MSWLPKWYMINNCLSMQGMSRDVGSIPGLGRSPGEGNGNHSSTLAWEIHGQRSLAGYSPWGRKESGVTGGQNTHMWRVLHVGLTLDSLSLSHTHSHQYYSKTLLFISSSMSCGLNTIIKHLRLDDYIYILADQMYNENQPFTRGPHATLLLQHYKRELQPNHDE